MKPEISTHIVEKAKEFGASLAGVANVEKVKNSPSHFIYGKLDPFTTVGNIRRGVTNQWNVVWPENAKSVIVIAVCLNLVNMSP